MEWWIRKMRLTQSARPRKTTVQFVGSAPWGKVVIIPTTLVVYCSELTLVVYCSELTLDCSWTRNMVTWFMDTDSMWDVNLCNFGPNTCSSGRQIPVHSGRIIYHRDRVGDDRLVSWDVCGWWVARGISRRATRMTIGWGDLVLCWFDSQVYGAFLFHLVAWWFCDTLSQLCDIRLGFGHREKDKQGSLTFMRYDRKVHVNGDGVVIAKWLLENCKDLSSEW